MSPAEAARPGETVERLGEEFGQLATGIGSYVRKAQEHVDKLAAENQLNAAYLAMQDDLAKTTNSRDVEGVLKQANDNVAHIMQEWGKSPASRDIELTAQGYLPHFEHQANMRQVDLLGKENQVHLTNLNKALLNEVVDPASAAAASAKWNNALDGSVRAKLMDGWQAEAAKDAFRVASQETLLDRFSSSPNPADNKSGLDDLIQHPEHYPDLDSHKKAEYKQKLEAAFRVNTDFMERVGVKQFVDKELPEFRKMYSRADGSFDLQGAIKEVDRREGLPASDPDHINATLGGDALRNHLRADDADRKEIQAAQNRDDLDKYGPQVDEHKLSLSQIWQLRDTHQISQSTAASLEKMLQTNVRIERQELNAQRAEVRAERADVREQRAEERFKDWENLKNARNNSRNTALSYYQAIGNGEKIDISELYSRAGVGAGQILPADIKRVESAVNAASKDPSMKESLSLINAFAPLQAQPGDSAEVQERKRLRKMELHAILQREVEMKGLKGFDVVKQTNEMLDQASQQEIGEYINNMMRAVGMPTETGPWTPTGRTYNIPARSAWGTRPASSPGAMPVPKRPNNVPEQAVWNPDEGTWELPPQ
jgi:hypothetical protein